MAPVFVPTRGRQARAFLSLLTLLVALAPLLSACSATVVPALVITGDRTPLPQAVEAYMADLPGPSPKLFLTTRVYDRKGTPMGEFWDEGRRYWVTLDRISPAVRQATIATEDKSFYTNPGVDWTAIARAVVQNSGEGDVVSGGSTITQQLARNIAMPFERRIEQSLDRKVSETLLADDLTKRFSKDQVLEMYLNVVNYGHLAYGIEAAARTYFAKSASALTLPESALLAALPQSPATLDPLVPENASRAKERQGIVLALMARNGYLTAAEAEAAYAEPLNYKSEQQPAVAPHFMQYLRQYLAAQFGADMVGRGGFTIVSSLDLRLQSRGESIVRQQVDAVRQKFRLSNAALVALKPQTGEILAMVGSANYADASINGQVNVAISPRQPGSAIKPVLYALAFSRGLTPGDMIWDTPVSYRLSNGKTYSPVNYDGKFHGPVRLRLALANSYNVPAVKLLNQMSVPDMLTMAHAMGITGLNDPPENYGLSLTLGGSEITLLDLTAAFATLDNSGVPAAPTPIHTLTDSTGHTVIQFNSPRGAAVDPRVAYMVTSVLSDNEARLPMFGANSPLKLSRTAAAKTGTTTDWRDNWTVGYTPSLVTGVWAGNANGQPMLNTTGLTGAAPIWHDFMEAVFADAALDKAIRLPGEPLDFVRPPGLIDVPLCDVAAIKAGASCPAGRTDLALDPAQPILLPVPGKIAAATPAPGKPSPGLAAGQAITATKAGDPAVLSVMAVSYAPGRYCTTPDGQPIAALRLPADPAERQTALQWAAQVGIPVEPGPCDAAMLASAAAGAGAPGQASLGPITANAQITSPAGGSIVRGPVDVVGDALFNPQEFQFYKVEFGYGGNPGEWITMGSGHQTPVNGGWLETWHADALPSGTYALRIVLVKRDGNYVMSSPVEIQVQH